MLQKQHTQHLQKIMHILHQHLQHKYMYSSIFIHSTSTYRNSISICIYCTYYTVQ